MARKFLTPIDLTGLELTNFKVQNLGTDPSAYGKGHTYYNTAHNELRVYDGSQWVAVGGAVEFGTTSSRPVAGNAGRVYADTQTYTWYLDNGTSWIQIGVNADDVASAISAAALTSTDGLSEGTTNLYYTNSRVDTELSNTFGISKSGSDLVINPSGGSSFIGSNSDTNNRIATIGDLTSGSVQSVTGTTNQITATTTLEAVTLNLPLDVKIDQSLQVGGWNDADNGFITVKNYLGTNVLEVNSNLSPNDQYHGYNTYTNATGVININSFVNLSSEGNTPAGFLYVNANGGASTYPTVHLEATGDLALRAGASDSHANDGNIILYTGSTSGSGTGKVYIGWNNNGGAGANASNQVATIGDVNDAKFITSVDSNNFTVDAGQLLLNTTIYTNTVSSTNTGADNFFLRGGYSNINLNSDTGNIELNPDGVVNVHSDLFVTDGHNLTVGNNAFVKYGLYTGGATTATDGYITLQDASGADLVTLSGTSGTGHIQTHGDLTFYTGYSDGGTEYGQLSYDGDKNLVINANFNNLVLQSDSSSAYIGSVAPDNKIVKYSDLAALSAGFDWKQAANLLYDASSPVLTGDTVTSPLVIDGHLALGTAEAGVYRVLIINSDNAGIYTYNVAGTTWTLDRSSDADTYQKLIGAAIFIEEGTKYGATSWVQNNHYLTDFTGQTWHQFSGAGTYTEGYGIAIDGTAISVKLDSDSLSESASGLKVNYQTNYGLDNDGGLYVKTGQGITFDGSGNVAIDTNVVARKYSTDLTYSGSPVSTFTVTHGLGTKHVQVTVFEKATGEDVIVDVTRPTTDTVQIDFAVAPDSNAYTVVVIG